MKKLTVLSLIISTLVFTLNSCSGCVKKTTKKATEISLSAMEGVVEAIDENGEKIAEKTTTAAGKVAGGIGKGLTKFLDEHATEVFETTGKTLIKSLDGLAEGMESEMQQHYDTLSYTSNLTSGIEIQYIGKYKYESLIDCYIKLANAGTYQYTFTCYDSDNAVLLKKEIEVNKQVDDAKTYTLVSIGLDVNENKEFKKRNKLEISIYPKTAK